MLQQRPALLLLITLLALICLPLPAATADAAAPLTCSITPGNTVIVNTNIQVSATGGTGPYWVTISDPSMVLYTPGKLDRQGRASGVWVMKVVKPGQCTFTMKDAAGATATATVTITAAVPGSPAITVPPLSPSMSNRAPYKGEEVTLTVSGGVKPYTVTVDNATVSLTPTGETTWKVKALTPGNFCITVRDAGQRTATYTGTVQERSILLNATIDRTKLYCQVPPGAVQQPVNLRIITGNPPYGVLVDSNFLEVRDAGQGLYYITSKGRGGDTVITVRDNKMQEKSWTVHAANPLFVKFEPVNRQLKAGEGFVIYILSGEPPFSVKTWAEGAYVSEGLKGSNYVASYFVGGLKPGVHKINVTDASFSATNFGYQFEVTVTQ